MYEEHLFYELRLARQLLSESTLTQLPAVKSAPGGLELAKELHKSYQLDNTADWQPLDWTDGDWQSQFPSTAFMVVVGREGVAGVKNKGWRVMGWGRGDLGGQLQKMFTERTVIVNTAQGSVGPDEIYYRLNQDVGNPAEGNIMTDNLLIDDLRYFIGDIVGVWVADNSLTSDPRSRKFLDFEPQYKEKNKSVKLDKNKPAGQPFDTASDSYRMSTAYSPAKNDEPTEFSRYQEKGLIISQTYKKIRPLFNSIAQKQIPVLKRRLKKQIQVENFRAAAASIRAVRDWQQLLKKPEEDTHGVIKFFVSNIHDLIDNNTFDIKKLNSDHMLEYEKLIAHLKTEITDQGFSE